MMSILVRLITVLLATILLGGHVYADDWDEKCANKYGNIDSENDNDKPLRLVIGEYHLSVNKLKTICVDLDKTYKLKIKNPKKKDFTIQPGTVKAGNKPGAPFKIEGNNNDDPLILELTFSDLDDPGSDSGCGDGSDDVCAGFWIEVDGVGKLDPKVRVVGGSELMGYYQIVLQEALDEIGMTLEEATMILRDLETSSN